MLPYMLDILLCIEEAKRILKRDKKVHFMTKDHTSIDSLLEELENTLWLNKKKLILSDDLFRQNEGLNRLRRHDDNPYCEAEYQKRIKIIEETYKEVEKIWLSGKYQNL